MNENKQVVQAVTPIVSDSGQILEIINRVATDPNADIDKMERLLVMYQEIQKGNAEKAFFVALQTVQAEMPRIQKDADNRQTKSRYATLEALNAGLIPIYTAHGFSLSFGTGQSPSPDLYILVTCRVSHIAGHSRDYEYASPVTTTGIQGNAMMTRTHASGSALSYGRRYLTLMIFNVTMASEDDDGNSATPKEEPPKIGPKRKRKIIDGMLAALAKQDGPGLLEISEELENDEKLAIWSELRSWERSEIKTLLAQATHAAGIGDPNFIPPQPQGLDLGAWSITAINTAKTKDGLQDTWKAVQAAYKQAGREVPGDVETSYIDRRDELSK